MQRRKTKTTVKPSGARSRNGNSSNSIEYVAYGDERLRPKHCLIFIPEKCHFHGTFVLVSIHMLLPMSPSALSSFSRTATRNSIGRFLRPKWLTSWKILLRIIKEGVENDELGQGIEVGHSNCTVYVSGNFQLKRWEGVHSSWRHHFQRSFARFFSLFPSADLPLYGARLHSLYLFLQIV